MWIGNANDGRFKHPRMLRDDVLPFIGKHLEAGDIDHVLLAIEDFQIALLIKSTDVTGVQPAAFAENKSALIGTLPIALHDLRPADTNLARLADRKIVPVIVTDNHVGRRDRKSDSADLRASHRIEADDRRRFSKPVAFHQLGAGDLAPAYRDRALHRRAAADGKA